MEDGWDDDDDDIDLDATIPANASTLNEIVVVGEPYSAKTKEMVVADGWDDFGDLDGDDDEMISDQKYDSSDDNKIGISAAAPSTSTSTQLQQTTKQDRNENGWDEDEDDDGLHFDDDEWGNENGASEEGIINDEFDIKQQQQQPIPSQPTSPLFEELGNYVRSLNRMVPSINAILEFEYNTLEKAQELVEYYASRPQLVDYTITKELQRMDYQIVLPHGHIESNKQCIVEQNLLSNDSLVSRASNQSLLADLLHVITGPDLIVRPQYLAICVAKWCQFTVHLGDGHDLVQCQANLHLSLPTTNPASRLDIAQLAVSVVFAPSQPMIEYKVHRIDVFLHDPSQLEGCVQFLDAIEGHWDEIPDIVENQRLQNAPVDIFRDQFLVNSQRFLLQSTQGMKSALHQVDSVINVRGKLQAISNFIPSTDTMMAAEQEAMELAEARRQEMERRQQQHPSRVFARSPQQQSPPPIMPDFVNRPKSILGTLLGAVAHSVALPDEGQTIAIHGATNPQTRTKPPDQPLHFDRKDYCNRPLITAAFPTLYQNKQEDVQVSMPKPSPASELPLHHRHEDSSPKAHSQDQPAMSSFRPKEAGPSIISPPETYHPMSFHAFDIYKNDTPKPNDYSPRELKTGKVVAEDDWQDEDQRDAGKNILGDNESKEYTMQTTKSDQYNNNNNNNNKELEVLEDGWDNLDDGVVVDIVDSDEKDDSDLVPTRKRWLNPRPNRPYLYGLGYT
jgi:hypothetical protein